MFGADARRIMRGMSRLRCLEVSDRWFFIACCVLPGRGFLSASELASVARVIEDCPPPPAPALEAVPKMLTSPASRSPISVMTMIRGVPGGVLEAYWMRTAE